MININSKIQQNDGYVLVANQRKSINLNSKGIKCSKCGVIFCEGKWQWSNALYINSTWCTCPACLMIDKHQPASCLTLYSWRSQIERASILKFIYAITNLQLNINPMDRLMAVKELSNSLMMISFTDNGSSERIGKQLIRQYGGQLMAERTKCDGVCRFRWSC